MSQVNKDDLLREVNNLFTYDKETGEFYWLNPPQPNYKRLVGKLAGTLGKQGYFVIMIKKKGYKVHKLVWLIEKGYYPQMIDHIDGNTTNNKITNLREASFRLNAQNNKRVRNNPKLLGAHWHKRSKTWRSHIVINGKQVSLGCFKTSEEAHKAYCKKWKRLYE